MVESKQVRVDNWGTFFLQRLQVFFAKTDYCDLTLQFEGNVQLKVHRLVMNACTEYFRLLEETCPTLEENTIMMPPELQSDVIVSIVNFMYTGMLEFPVTIYERLYKAAELMNITILTKLLDAQKINFKPKIVKPVKQESQKRPTAIKPPELISPLTTFSPKKVPLWKRKPLPIASNTIFSNTNSNSNLKSSSFSDQQRIISSDSADNTPRPTRFEWPDDDLPNINMIDTGFEDISYNSKPLLTKEEEEKIKPSFDDLKYNIELPKKISPKSTTNTVVNFKEIEEFAKEQKIRTTMFEEMEELNDIKKRKADSTLTYKTIGKKIKLNNKENKETTISVESNTPGDIDHTKIVTEILKKYPDLVKKNKNIKLKIMPGNKEYGDKKVMNAVVEQVKKPKNQIQIQSTPKAPEKLYTRAKKPKLEHDDEGPWICKKCTPVGGGETQEFVLYYLYRKHMTDVHDEVFDNRCCKYCGRRCTDDNLMMYHMYTKHALKPPANYKFPQCDKCPFIALNPSLLKIHSILHNPNEMQCQDCKLAFTSALTLSAHIRVTGHFNKPGRVVYDCQYCMKKLQSCITLFTHIRKTHYNEGIRDGIVCLEEVDILENLEELEEPQDDDGLERDEYILPENLSESSLQRDKVKIISNVKVPASQQDNLDPKIDTNEPIPLEASSEAEALNSVASGIATSLNLVDIVVLDDNQQYILQQDDQNEQEFILPELGHGQPFTGQVITTQDSGVIQQGMIQSSNGDISSTDELVMVLTDHDYPDGPEGENPENSNIVVLYSHPVEGQEGQFITSQGNIMVNSQTGMLEIRNGPTIATTTASQMIVTNSVDAPVESIEMIQREIESHAVLKQDEPFLRDIKNTLETDTLVSPSTLETIPNIQDVPITESQEISVSVPNVTQQLEDSHNESNSQPQINAENINANIDEVKEIAVDLVDANVDANVEEPMDIDDLENNKNIEIHQSNNQSIEETHRPEGVLQAEEGHQLGQGVDVPPDTSVSSINDTPFLNHSDEPVQPETIQCLPPISEEAETINEDSTTQLSNVVEQMEVDGKVVEHQEPQCEKQETECENETTENDIEQPQVAEESEKSILPEIVKSQADATKSEEVQHEENIQNIEENPTADKKFAESSTDINKSILEDWEDDTDSQQSEKNVADTSVKVTESVVPAAVENVNKLMDDWDEEEEEEEDKNE